MEYSNIITFENGIAFIVGAVIVFGCWRIFDGWIRRWAFNKAVKQFSKDGNHPSERLSRVSIL